MKYLILIIFCFSIYAEDRIKIGIIDTGVSQYISRSKIICDNGIRGYIKDNPYDEQGHGSNIYTIISRNLDPEKYCIISYKVWTPNFKDNDVINHTIKSLEDAINEKVKYINISMAGEYSNTFDELKLLYESIEKITVAVAAGNDGRNLDTNCNIFPACYKLYITSSNFHVVGSYDTRYSNYGNIVTNVTTGTKLGTPSMSGTSQATANYLNKLILKEGK